METLEDIRKSFKDKSYDDLLVEISSLQAERDQLRHLLFNRRSEKSKALYDGPALFDEAEQLHKELPEEEKDLEQVTVGEFKRRKGGRKKLPKDLDRERVEHDLPDSEKVCSKHKVDLVKIGEKVTEKLDIVPAKLKVIENVTFTYKCPCCSDEAKESGEAETFVTSKSETNDLIPKSMATPSLLAYVATRKYQDALPLARQEKIFDRYGISLNRTTLARWMITVGDKVTPLLNLMRDDILANPAIGCDETPTQVLKEPQRPPDRRSYMWVVRSFSENPLILFQYFERRNAKTAYSVLDNYQGTVVCDGLKSYDSWANYSGATLAACLAHIRRKFDIARKAAKKASPKSTPKAVEVLKLIRQLYKIEDELASKSNEEILEDRQLRSTPIMNEIFDWLDVYKNQVLPKSLLGKAITYAINQWEKMNVFLHNPYVRIDNNPTEQVIKPFATGRKNWYFAQTPEGAHASAAIYSLVESAKANNVEPFSYLSIVFKELPQAQNLEDFDKLLPNKISQHFQVKTYRSV